MSSQDVDYNRNILNREGVELPEFIPPANHGHTTAAWFLVIVAIIGALAIALGMPLNSTPMIIVGIVVIFVGLIGSAVLSKSGKGQVAVKTPKN